MAEKLTPQQQLAVDNRGGKLLVSAAAGSVSDLPAVPDRVLAPFLAAEACIRILRYQRKHRCCRNNKR